MNFKEYLKEAKKLSVGDDVWYLAGSDDKHKVKGKIIEVTKNGYKIDNPKIEIVFAKASASSKLTESKSDWRSITKHMKDNKVKTSVGIGIDDEIKDLERSLTNIISMPSLLSTYIKEEGFEYPNKDKWNKIIDLAVILAKDFK